MKASYERKRLKLETDYWLFKARRELVLQLIKKTNSGQEAKILDIGCSGGHFLNLLKENGFKKAVGIDISKRAVKTCRKKGLKNIFVDDARKTRFRSKTFDLVIAADVLEHLEGEQAVLKEWKRILKKGGKLIVTVPAFNFLWSQHDVTLHHLRRYSRLELIKTLKRTGFSAEKSSYWNFTLFLPVSLLKVFQRFFLKNKKKKGDHLYKLNPLINNILFYILKLENRFVMRSNFPVGISVFAVAEKH